MNLSSSDDATRRVYDALERAGDRARRLAAQTQTDIIVIRDGRLVREPASQESAEVTRPEGKGLPPGRRPRE